MRLQRHEHKLKDIERMEFWVYRIARNLLIDYYRREEMPSVDSNGTQTVSSVSEHDTDKNHNQHIGRWLRDAIEQLPEPYRGALRMYEIESMPQQEIAGKMDISLSAAKSRIQRGRAKLKELLSRCCALDMDARGNIVDYRQIGDDCNNECRD